MPVPSLDPQTTAHHIAKQRRYPDFATLVEAHISADERSRDILQIRCGYDPGRNHRRIGVFIGANPSAADPSGSDATVNKVLRALCSGDVLGWSACNEVLIVNLSPLRATWASEAVAALDEPGAIAESLEKNVVAMKALDDAIQSGIYRPVIWPGWGDCLKHHTSTLAAPFVDMLRGREVIHLPPLKSGQPGHPCRAPLSGLRRSVLWPVQPPNSQHTEK